jgi:beta-glucosidase
MNKMKGLLPLLLGFAAVHAAPGNERTWMDVRKSPDERATLAVAAMTLDEQIGLLHGPMAIALPVPGFPPLTLPPDAVPGAGYIPGVPRLGIPSLRETDASLGIGNPVDVRPGDVATALPSSLALASSFEPELAHRVGAMLGQEARSKGFNVLLGGGMDLTRDPRNGRNFEYLGEDPLLAGVMAGEEVRGTQAEHVISTIKHFALNANETNRYTLDALVDEKALQESDLLAFDIAIERGRPGSIMCAYNKVNGAYACGNDWLLNRVLKQQWGYKGWVMSDWGAVHATDYALSGLDQQSGEQLDKKIWFGDALKSAVIAGTVPRTRVADMAHRIVRSMFDVGIIEHPPVKANIDYAAHAALALEVAQKGIVLLKNDHALLPIDPSVKRIAVIGGNANLGVLSGGGSAQVVSSNGTALRIPLGDHGLIDSFRRVIFDSGAPLAAIEAALPNTKVVYDSGAFPADAAVLASKADMAIVFVTRHELENFDVPDMSLPYGQTALIEAVTAANPHTVVVLETGNPVTMPWAHATPAIVEAWFPGQAGGQALADILVGKINPSGRLPMTFARSESDLVRPKLPNFGTEEGAEVSVNYSEGADVGYRWYGQHAVMPLFAFGHGMSYTHFSYGQVKVVGGKALTAQFVVRNDGKFAGADVPQLYLTSAAGKSVLRLVAFTRVDLKPGESQVVTLTAEPRLLASFEPDKTRWSVMPGIYQVSVGKSADELLAAGTATITASFPR